MARVLLGVTGSVAAIKTPDLYRALCTAGHEVQVVATQAATYFFDVLTLGQDSESTSEEAVRRQRRHDILHLDEDEWPGREEGRAYQRGDPVLHIELRRWAELLLVAPLDANTLAKLACGLADNCLTCVWRAWDPVRPVLLAPAMNTLMWEHPLTARHLRQLAADAGAVPPDDLPLQRLPEWITEHCPALHVLAPESRELACGDVGVGAMARVERIVAAVATVLRR